jgi:uncharacterized membrane protein YdbT with pleckstrin-like domain
MPNQTDTVAIDPLSPEKAEPVVARLRRHGRVLVLPSIALIVLAGTAGYGPSLLTEEWMVTPFWIATSTLVLLLWLLPLITWMGSRVIITTRRVIVYNGLFVRTRQEILCARIHDVTVRRTAIQGTFGSGDVLLNTGAEKPIRLRDLPKPNLVLSALTDLVEKNAPLRTQLRRDDSRWNTDEI